MSAPSTSGLSVIKSYCYELSTLNKVYFTLLYFTFCFVVTKFCYALNLTGERELPYITGKVIGKSNGMQINVRFEKHPKSYRALTGTLIPSLFRLHNFNPHVS